MISRYLLIITVPISVSSIAQNACYSVVDKFNKKVSLSYVENRYIHSINEEGKCIEYAEFDEHGALLSGHWISEGVLVGIDSNGTHWSVDMRRGLQDTIYWSFNKTENVLVSEIRFSDDLTYTIYVASNGFPFHGFMRTATIGEDTREFMSLFPIKWIEGTSTKSNRLIGFLWEYFVPDLRSFYLVSRNDFTYTDYKYGSMVRSIRCAEPWYQFSVYDEAGDIRSEVSYYNDVIRQLITIENGRSVIRIFDEKGRYEKEVR